MKFAIIIVFEIVALFALIVADKTKNGYAILCIVDGISIGIAATHLIPGTSLYIGTTFDIVFNAVFGVCFAYFLISHYKLWKNAK